MVIKGNIYMFYNMVLRLILVMLIFLFLVSLLLLLLLMNCFIIGENLLFFFLELDKFW